MKRKSACALFVFAFGAVAAAQVQTVHPDSLAGHWEASDGRGGDLGIDIVLTTDVPSTTTDLVGVPQRVGDLSIGLSERAHSSNEPQHFYFSTSTNGGANWDGQHLRIDFGGAKAASRIHIDLTWVESDQAWTGSFEWNDFRQSELTLRRPRVDRSDRFAGTWFEPGRLMNNCLHLARKRDGTLFGWGDDIHVPGHDHYANGLRLSHSRWSIMRTGSHHNGPNWYVHGRTQGRNRSLLLPFLRCQAFSRQTVARGRMAGWTQSGTGTRAMDPSRK